jgi:pyruvate dehydrogenase E1 component
MTSALREAVEFGAYWHTPPQAASDACLVFCGCVLPEAVEAQRLLVESRGLRVALLQVTSPDRLFKSNHGGEGAVRELLRDLPPAAPIVTVHDGHPAALSWLGGVRGHAVRSLGVSAFGQSGDQLDLYKHFGIDAESVVKTVVDAVSSTKTKAKASKAKTSKAKAKTKE